MSNIRFGVPAFDVMFKDDLSGINVAEDETTTICLMGPDGTGKSIFGLHLASYYAADSNADIRPRVFYISTDLSFWQANKHWGDFGLNQPGGRKAHYASRTLQKSESGISNIVKVDLVPYAPLDGRHEDDGESGGAAKLSEYLANPPTKPTVAYIDLATATAGDDWGFVTRTLALLDKPHKPAKPANADKPAGIEKLSNISKAENPDKPVNPDKSSPRHIMIIDAIEGFETMAGDKDAYGEDRTRRSRIAQVIRAAAGKCHLVFIVEEPRDGERIPEQFVSDVVVRLRSTQNHGYNRRTLEIEKARGHAHKRGLHPYVIRGGGGSKTGGQENWDDPFVGHAYVHVLQSVHSQYRDIMHDPNNTSREQDTRSKYASFGIEYLDQMLASKPESDRSQKLSASEWAGDDFGLPVGSTTALIGDSGTQKSRLGTAFLSGAFAVYAKRLIELAKQMPANGLQDPAALTKAARRLDQQMLAQCGAAVLISTHDTNVERETKRFLKWLKRNQKIDSSLDSILIDHMIRHTVCRRLEIHNAPPELLIHVVQRAVEKAQDALYSKVGNAQGRFDASGRIRLVIDDLNIIHNMYTDVRQDPLFLPFILFYLGREGTTNLIIDTQSGRPDFQSNDNELKAAVRHRLYTWRIPFFGESRVAITAIPPMSSKIRVIRELHWESEGEGDPLIVDPHFELYRGLEEGKPELVPLSVRLAGGSLDQYANEVNELFRGLFSPVDTGGKIVTCDIPGSAETDWSDSYDALRDLSFLKQDTRLDHTLVFALDEFWAIGNSPGLYDLSQYLSAETCDAAGVADKVLDPYGFFQNTRREDDGEKKPTGRWNFFPVPGIQAISDEDHLHVDRVPYTWLFGFLLCRKTAWENSLKEELPVLAQSIQVPGRSKQLLAEAKAFLNPATKIPDVKRIWDAMGSEPASRGVTVPWRIFLEACSVVAKSHTVHEADNISAFDLTMPRPGSLACLVLEIWASEILRTRTKAGSAEDFVSGVNERRWGQDRNGNTSLIDWLLGPNQKSPKYEVRLDNDAAYALELYKTFVLLSEVLKIDEIIDPERQFETLNRDPGRNAVAARYWYAPACSMVTPFNQDDPLVPIRLPGNFTVRGDWFLAIASGSRSTRLGERAIDILSSRRANISRLQAGIGLPTRDIVARDDYQLLRTGLYTVDEDKLIRSPSRDRKEKYPKRDIRKNVTYEDLLCLGEHQRNPKMHWFWRSRLKDYDRHARIWEKWIVRVLCDHATLRRNHAGDWYNGFKVYDLADRRSNKIEDFETYKKFGKLCDFLIGELKKATP